jgi:hypothetical protein
MLSFKQLLSLRIVALALSENQHTGWWRSQFLAPTSLSFLDRLYPRSAFAAAVQAATLRIESKTILLCTILIAVNRPCR